MTYSYDDLVRFLNGLSDGDFNEQVASRLSKLLTFCWESFDGSSETSMAAHKIDGRARGFKWKSPTLTFEIERHGGTVNGSTRADRQEWTIDVEKRTARPAMIGYRQLTPRASAFKTEPVVGHFVDVVSQRLTTPPGCREFIAFARSALWRLTLRRLRESMPSVRPIEPGPCQELRAAVVDARGHAKAVKLDLVDPLRPRWRLLNRLRKLRRDEERKRRIRSAAPR